MNGLRRRRRDRLTRDRGRRAGNRGSILLLTLFACLALALVVQVLTAVILCGQRAITDEVAGRARLAEKDVALAALRQSLQIDWRPVPAAWSLPQGLGSRGKSDAATQGSAESVSEGGGRLMRATVRQDPEFSHLVAQALAERGRDGLDLPIAAVVAGSLTASAGRVLTWVDAEAAAMSGPPDPLGAPSGPALAVGCYLRHAPVAPSLGGACVLEELPGVWRLDPGWARLAATDFPAAPGASGSSAPAVTTSYAALHVSPGDRVVLLKAEDRQALRGAVTLPPDCGGASAEEPVLVMVTGGVDLDARDLGEFYGVIVVDEGSARLDGTVLHGSVFVSNDLDLGETGRVLFSLDTLQWATDRSLCRVRLVPGTRREGIE